MGCRPAAMPIAGPGAHRYSPQAPCRLQRLADRGRGQGSDMSSGIEAVGDVATGALAARAIEPAHGEHGAAGHGKCLNCRTELVGPYCHACGQNSHIHRTIAGFVHDLLHGVFHFEGKIWATLPMLFFKPGDLTRRYVAGERAKFVSPMAMFLFCVFLMFAIVGGLAGEMHTPELSAADKARPLSEIRASMARNEAQMTQLRAQIREEGKAGRDTSALERKLDDLESDTDHLELALNFVTGGREGKAGTALGFHTGWAALDHGIEAANRNPNLFLYRLQSSAYKYSWLLIPLSTPFVWLLFCWKRQYRFYDHLVFVTFSLTFMLLLVTILTVAGAIGIPAGIIGTVAMVVPPLHIYRQVRGAYRSGRATALLRTGILVMFGFIVLALYLMILLAMGIMH